MQYAPTLSDKNLSGFWFVFIRRIKNRIGINFIRPPACPCRGVCNTPLHGQTKTGLVFGSFLFGESKIGSKLDSFDHRRGRLWGVCNTPLPYRAKIHRGFGSFLPDESKIGSELISFDHCRGRLWGVCNTPLPYRAKIHRGFGSFLSGESKIGSELISFGP